MLTDACGQLPCLESSQKPCSTWDSSCSSKLCLHSKATSFIPSAKSFWLLLCVGNKGNQHLFWSPHLSQMSLYQNILNPTFSQDVFILWAHPQLTRLPSHYCPWMDTVHENVRIYEKTRRDICRSQMLLLTFFLLPYTHVLYVISNEIPTSDRVSEIF